MPLNSSTETKDRKIGVFTPRSLKPLHPRLHFFKEYFEKNNFQVEFVTGSDYPITLSTRINWLVLWFFDLYALKLCKNRVKEFDVVIINDLKYLPLARYANKLGKVVLYDTIDHNVYLRFYQLEKKIKWIRVFKKQIISFFISWERRLAFNYCHQILVNSDSLNDYFKHRAVTLFYNSPFERLQQRQEENKPPALLYLGAFTIDKGANEILILQSQLNIPLYIFGPVTDNAIQSKLNIKEVYYSPKISIEELLTKLDNLFNVHFFFGFSLISPVHYSYEVQEANKDIDYLALGIPLIGNHRLATKEKIEGGCGIFNDDPDLKEKIFNPELRAKLSQACQHYYYNKYSSDLAYRKLDIVMNSILHQRVFE